MTQAEIRDAWKVRVDAYRASGQPASEWCEEHQVTTRQLWYWMRKFKDANQKPAGGSTSQWISVNIDKQTARTESTLRVMVGSVAIEVKPGFNPSLLSDVVRTLKSLC